MSKAIDFSNLPIGSTIEEIEFKENNNLVVKNRYKTISVFQNGKYETEDENGNRREFSFDELLGYIPEIALRTYPLETDETFKSTEEKMRELYDPRF